MKEISKTWQKGVEGNPISAKDISRFSFKALPNSWCDMFYKELSWTQVRVAVIIPAGYNLPSINFQSWIE